MAAGVRGAPIPPWAALCWGMEGRTRTKPHYWVSREGGKQDIKVISLEYKPHYWLGGKEGSKLIFLVYKLSFDIKVFNPR